MKTMEPIGNPTKRLIAIGLLALAWANPDTGVSAADTLKNDWPRFRGPTGDGVSLAKGIPTTWSATGSFSLQFRQWSCRTVIYSLEEMRR